MADGRIIIDTLLDETGIKKGLGMLGSLAKTGAKAVAAVGTALAAATGAAVKFGAEFEASVAKASTLFGDVKVDMDGLNGKILELSDSTGVAASQIGESLYNALSAGIPATQDMGAAIDYMDKSAKLAKAGFTDIDTAVTATAKVLNAYKMDVSETDRVHKILMATQNKGITTVGELGSVLAQVTPTAAAMGLEFEQVGAALATMTAQGTPTAQATTQLNSLLAELGKKGQQAEKNLSAAAKGTKYAGKSFQDMMAAGVPLNEVLALMDDYAKKNGKSMLDMFGSIEAGKAALAMAGQNSAKFADNLAAMSTKTDLVGEAYAKVSNTLQDNTARIGNSLKNLGIAIYQDIDNPLADVAGTAAGMVLQLSEAFQRGGLEGLVGELGDVLAQAVSKVAEAIPVLAKHAAKLMQSFVRGILDYLPQIADAAFKATETFLRNFLGKEVSKSFNTFSKEVRKTFSEVKKLISAAMGPVKNIIGNIVRILLNFANAVLPTVSKAVKFLAEHFNKLIPVIGAVIGAWKGYKIFQTVTSLFSKAKVALQTFSGAAQGATVKTQLFTAAQKVLKSVMSLGPGGIAALVGAFAGAVALAALAMKDGKSAAERLKDSQKDLAESYETISEGAEEFTNKIEDAESAMSDFDESLILSDDARQKVETAMSGAQKALTEIVRSESAQRGELTKKETGKMRELFSEIKSLADQEIAFQKLRQDANETATDAFLENYKGTIDEFEEESARYVKAAHEEAAGVADAAAKKRDKVIQNAYQMIGKSKEYTEKWYEDEAAAAWEAYQFEVDMAKLRETTVTKKIADDYLKRNTNLREYLDSVTDINKKIRKEQKQHAESEKKISASVLQAYKNGHIKKSLYYTAEEEAQLEYNRQISGLNTDHLELMSGYFEELGVGMDKATLAQAGSLLQMIVNVQKDGGRLTEEQKNLATNLVQALAHLPGEMEQQGLDALRGLGIGLQDDGTVTIAGQKLGTSLIGAIEAETMANDQMYHLGLAEIATHGQGLRAGAKALVDPAGEVAETTIGTINERTMAKDQLYHLGLAGISTYGQGIDAAVNALTGSAGEVAETTMQTIEERTMANDRAKQLAGRAVAQYGAGLDSDESLRIAEDGGEGLAGSFFDGLASLSEKSYGLGEDYGEGYARGIESKKLRTYNAGATLAESADKGTKDKQRSSSPSKVARGLGGDYGEGYALGIEDCKQDVADAAAGLAETATEAVDQNALPPVSLTAELDASSLPEQVRKMASSLSMRMRAAVAAQSAQISTVARERASYAAAPSNITTNHVGGDTYNINQPVATPGEMFRASKLARKEAAYE